MLWRGKLKRVDRVIHRKPRCKSKVRPLEVDASGALADGDDDVLLMGNLGLDIIREVVGIVAREDHAARHGRLGVGREHLLDVVLVLGLDDGRDVEVSLALSTVELDLAEHARGVLLSLGDGVEVANVLVREGHSLLLRGVDLDGLHIPGVFVGGEVDGTADVVKGPEGDLSGGGNGGRAEKSKDGGGELHFGGCSVGLWKACFDR